MGTTFTKTELLRLARGIGKAIGNNQTEVLQAAELSVDDIDADTSPEIVDQLLEEIQKTTSAYYKSEEDAHVLFKYHEFWSGASYIFGLLRAKKAVTALSVLIDIDHFGIPEVASEALQKVLGKKRADT